MANLKEIKGRIASVNSTQQITKAMKMVAAAKLRRAQDRILQLRPYSQKLSEVLHNVSSTLGDDASNVYAANRELTRVLVVVVTSDRGLCGSFNANVNKLAVQHINTHYKAQLDNGNVEILPIGAKAKDYFKKRGYQVDATHADLFTRLAFDTVREVAEMLMDSFLNKKYDRVDIVYNEFKNVATQEVHVDQFLPIQEQTTDETTADANKEQEYIFEPGKEEIIELIIPKSLKIAFYKAILESNAAEHGARMTAMDKATDNAAELLKELRLTYNRTRQAAITTEILEIVGGAEALAQGS